MSSRGPTARPLLRRGRRPMLLCTGIALNGYCLEVSLPPLSCTILPAVYASSCAFKVYISSSRLISRSIDSSRSCRKLFLSSVNCLILAFGSARFSAISSAAASIALMRSSKTARERFIEPFLLPASIATVSLLIFEPRFLSRSSAA